MSSHLSPEKGGPLRILELGDAESVHLKRWVLSLRARGHVVEVASFRGNEIGGVPVHRLGTPWLGKAGYFLAIPGLRRLVRQLRPDVIHAQHVTSYGFVAGFAGFRPTLLSAWGSDVLLTPFKSLLHRWVTRLALKRAAVVTVVATHMGQRVEQISGRSDWLCVPFGVNLQDFPFRLDREPFPRPVRLVCTRNLEPVYDHVTLIRALKSLRDKGIPWQIELIGEGSLRADLELQVREAGLADQVRFLGKLPQERLAQALREADVFISPSRSDGAAISVIEALASGCYPIATRIPANLQWIQDGEGGRLYEPGSDRALVDLLEAACRAPERRRAVAEQNRRVVETRADWQENVTEMEGLFRRLAGAGAGPG